MYWSIDDHQTRRAPSGPGTRVSDVIDAADVLNRVARTFSSALRFEVFLRLAAAAERACDASREAECEIDVTALTTMIGVNMCDVSKALGGLRDAGLVRGRKVGSRRRYALAGGVQIRRSDRTGAINLGIKVADGVALSILISEPILANLNPDRVPRRGPCQAC